MWELSRGVSSVRAPPSWPKHLPQAQLWARSHWGLGFQHVIVGAQMFILQQKGQSCLCVVEPVLTCTRSGDGQVPHHPKAVVHHHLDRLPPSVVCRVSENCFMILAP